MTVQFSLFIIGFLLLIMLGLLIWVAKLAAQKQIVINTSTKYHELKPPAAPKKAPSKYVNSTLTETQKLIYLDQVVEHLETQKLYRRPDLSIAQLAKTMNIPKHHLSQVINEKKQCSYLDFLNRYRIKEAVEKLQDTTLLDTSILDIGKQVGFNSKSTFYAAFKKYTNSTPGDLRKAILTNSKEQI